MFKKKKKDKQKGQVDKNQKNLSNNNGSMSNQLYDELDGFDKNGFVDLQPIESDATVLGPRQKCKVKVHLSTRIIIVFCSYIG